MKTKTLELIFQEAHAVAINMNDTFYYACADSASIDTEALEDLEPVIELYGSEAFMAYEAIKRGHDVLQQRINANYLGAKALIQDMMDKADKYGPFYELRDAVKQPAYKPEERKKISKAIAKLGDWFSFYIHR